MKAIQRSVSLLRPAYRNFTTSRVCFCRQSDEYVIKSQLSPTPVPNLSIDEFLLQKVDRWADKTAVVCAETGRSFTYAQYDKISERVAHALCAKLRLKKGDVLAVLLPNVPEFITVFLAAFKAGIVVTSINPVYTADEVARQMNDCSVKAIITLVQSHKTAELAIKKLKTNVHIPIITVKHEATDTTPEGAMDFKELCEYNGPQVRLERPSADDLAILPYSSGTSGLPKGVQLIHKNVTSDLVQIQHELIKINYETTSSHQDVVPIIVPLFHAYGMIPVLFNVFSEGCKSVVLPKYRPNLYLDMLEKYPAHIMHVVPPIVIMLCNNENAKRFHLKRLRHVISAAAPLASSDIDRFQEKFGQQIKVSQFYGLTETGPVTHAQRLDKAFVPGSIGWNVSLTECRVVSVDDDSTNLGPNKTGHLLLRGPNVMPGYHNNPKATEESIDKDGWFKTGDIAHYDDNGVFFITDRMKELIKVKGYQVAPAELEALIRDHPDVDDVAVTGVAHAEHGEAPRAYVVPRRNANLKPEHVQAYVKEKVAKHKQLTGGVLFVDTIPKNPSGKILRRMLKDM